MVYRVYRVYGYFQKSIYGIYFTFPIIRSGGWESDLLYRVLETRKKPDPTTHRPPLCNTNSVGKVYAVLGSQMCSLGIV